MALRRVGVGIAAVVAAVLSGCGIDKVDEHARQLDVIGDVEISTTFCTSGDMDQQSHSCSVYTRSHRGQALVAYRLPDGSDAPSDLTDDGGNRHFSLSASYTAYMEQTYPEAGMHWTGYVSDVYSTDAGAQYAFALSPELPLPSPGKPFEGPYRYQVVGGYRALTDPAEDGSAPVDCGETVNTSCTETGVADEDSAHPTRDLAVLPGAEVPTVVAGGEVRVPFDLRFVGAAGEPVRFQLAASSDLEGARVVLEEAALQPATDSSNAVGAVVSVPADTPPATYAVDLSATATGAGDPIIHTADGVERRAGRMTFRVVAAPPSPPVPDPVVVPPPPPDPVIVPPPPPDPVPDSVVAPPPPADPVVAPPLPVPAPVHAPPEHRQPRPAPRARFRLSLAARPRRAYSGGFATYTVVARNVSREPAVRTRVCETLPARVQFVRATRRVRFVGRDVCFDRRRLGAGASLATLVVVHVDTDARPGMARARATATAANADRAGARARLRVLQRVAPPRRAPVTG
jgi:uncharacterized repeat protein (TIGR01451 family)